MYKHHIGHLDTFRNFQSNAMRRILIILFLFNSGCLVVVSQLPPGMTLDDIPADMLPEGFSLDDIPPGFDINDIPPELLPDGISPDMIPPGMFDKDDAADDGDEDGGDGGDDGAFTDVMETAGDIMQPTMIQGLITPTITYNVSGYVGGSAVLNCTRSAGAVGPVTWLHPTDGAVVSSGRQVAEPLRDRLRIIGNQDNGEFHLALVDLLFPSDSGVWRCVSLGGSVSVAARLTVLVAPPSPRPTVSPDVADVTLDAYSDAWTFTCTAHHAHPPVTLNWRRLSGLDMEYDVTPPTYISSPDNTQAVSRKLIVTGRNFGSVFACDATHPSYGGKVYSQKAVYLPPQAMQAVSTLKARALALIPRLSLGASDYAMVAVIAAVVVLVFLTVFCLCATRRHWELDVRYPGDYVTALPVVHDTKTGAYSDACTSKTRRTSKDYAKLITLQKRVRCRCVAHVVVGSILSGLLLFSLLFAFPLYIKGISLPILSTDELTSVVAGSALWLDCGHLVTSPRSLLQIRWRKNEHTIYKQYLVNGEHVGFPETSSPATASLAGRVSSPSLGQLSVWPLRAGEEGVYSCEVAGIVDDTGRTDLTIRTFFVFVVSGLLINYVLLGLLGLCVLLTVALILLGVCHSCKRVHRERSVCLNHDLVHAADSQKHQPNSQPKREKVLRSHEVTCMQPADHVEECLHNGGNTTTSTTTLDENEKLLCEKVAEQEENVRLIHHREDSSHSSGNTTHDESEKLLCERSEPSGNVRLMNNNVELCSDCPEKEDVAFVDCPHEEEGIVYEEEEIEKALSEKDTLQLHCRNNNDSYLPEVESSDDEVKYRTYSLVSDRDDVSTEEETAAGQLQGQVVVNVADFNNEEDGDTHSINTHL